MAICQETRETVLRYKIVPYRGGHGVSLVVDSYYPMWKLQFSEIFCSFCRNITPFWNARPETISKGKLWDVFKTTNYEPRRGGEGKLILHILEALQTAPRKGANTFQAGSCIYSHDIPKHQTIFSMYKQQPVGWIYIFRRIDGFVVRYTVRNEVSFPVWEQPRVEDAWSLPFQTKTFWMFTLRH